MRYFYEIFPIRTRLITDKCGNLAQGKNACPMQKNRQPYQKGFKGKTLAGGTAAQYNRVTF